MANENKNQDQDMAHKDDPRQAMEEGEPSITGTKGVHTGGAPGSDQKDDPRQANESGEPGRGARKQ